MISFHDGHVIQSFDRDFHCFDIKEVSLGLEGVGENVLYRIMRDDIRRPYVDIYPAKTESEQQFFGSHRRLARSLSDSRIHCLQHEVSGNAQCRKHQRI